mmetsp:Transcript_41613/g.97772  ORF Transcript_41613/g.97772 Transcript_41613/m.97772 type:complete len:261 (-) Transcript_41613:1046-1828(-)
MMPWPLMLSASSYSEPSSMRVRGWYLPACSCSSFSVDGLPSRSVDGVSLTFGPSRASRPRPRPLGFLVAMGADCRSGLQQAPQQFAPLGPVAEARLGVQMAARAGHDDLRAPVLRHLKRTLGAAKGIVAADDGDAGKGQARPADRAPVVQLGRCGLLLGVGRRHQQGAPHPSRVSGMLGPACHQLAAERMRHQQRRRVVLQQHLVQAGHPVAAPRPVPVVLLDAHIAVQALPAALPVVGAGVLPAREKQHALRLHGLPLS